MNTVNLADFEAKVVSLRQDHAAANGIYLGSYKTGSDVFAQPPTDIVVTIDQLGIDGYNHWGAYDRSQIPEQSKQTVQWPEKYESFISKQNLTDRDTLRDIQLAINSENSFKQRTLELPEGAPRTVLAGLVGFSALKLIPETEASVAAAAKHYANNRQGYIAMALAEAFAKGIDINLNPSVDAVNVAVTK